MAKKVRLGFVGANIHTTWAPRSHFPALLASPDVELTAVCTTNPASAEEARKALGARLAFSDYREMVVSPDIDAVVVVVKVPSHHAPTRAAIEAGKHVFTEWPLGCTTAEAEELTGLARARGVQTAVGLQSRVSPPLMYMKELLEAGYVGEVLACHASAMRLGEYARPSHKTWQADDALGANPLTIYGGHIIDALRFVAGDFARLGSMVTTQVRQWHETDTDKMVDVTAPDNVMISGQLVSGAAASVHVGMVPWATPGYRIEVFGREGTLIASGKVSTQMGELPRLQGAQRSRELRDLEIPAHFSVVPQGFPGGTAFNLGQMYALFAQAVRTGQAPVALPTFATAVEMHHLIDSIRAASDAGRTLPVASRK